MNERDKLIKWLVNNKKDVYCNEKLHDDYLYKLQTWIRKEYNIHIVIEPYNKRYKCAIFKPNKFGYAGSGVCGGEIYTVSVPDCDFSESYEDCYTFEAYEEALACGLLQILKMMEKNGQEIQ